LPPPLAALPFPCSSAPLPVLLASGSSPTPTASPQTTALPNPLLPRQLTSGEIFSQLHSDSCAPPAAVSLCSSRPRISASVPADRSLHPRRWRIQTSSYHNPRVSLRRSPTPAPPALRTPAPAPLPTAPPSRIRRPPPSPAPLLPPSPALPLTSVPTDDGPTRRSPPSAPR